MPLILWVLIGVIVFSVAAALYAVQAARIRRELVLRLDVGGGVASAPITILRGTDEGWVTRLGRWLRENAPSSWSNAGVAAAVLLPLAAFVLGPQSNFQRLMILVVLAGAAGVIGPKAALDRLVSKRRDRIRKAIPDSLDLLVVCVEAGVGLDSAMLRVARDMSSLHPDLSAEFFLV